MEDKGSVAKMIEMWGNNPMLTSKLHVLLISWLHVAGFSQDFYKRDSFHEMIEMSDNNLMLTSKTAHFVKYLCSMLMDFHKTAIIVILLMR